MHIIEAYALNCGLKIDKPEIEEEEVTGIPENFILFNPHTKGKNKYYDKWQEVIDIIKPKLDEKNISIIQIDCFDKEYNGCIKIPKLSWNQTAFLTNKCLFLIGIDSFCMHLADSYKKNMIILWGGSADFNTCKPYFGDYNNYKFFIPYLKGNKPTYSFDTGQEFINQHNPQKISESIFELLKIK